MVIVMGTLHSFTVPPPFVPVNKLAPPYTRLYSRYYYFFSICATNCRGVRILVLLNAGGKSLMLPVTR